MWLDIYQSDENTSVAMVTGSDGMNRAQVRGIVPKDRVEKINQKEK